MSTRGEEFAAEVQRAAISRQASKDIKPLRKLLPFLAPYKAVTGLALLFLVIAATATLTVPQAVRGMIDHGFSHDQVARVGDYFLILLGVAGVLAVATAARFYFVTWLGERVVADIRRAVYDHVLKLSPAFFEVTRTGEVLSRLTTDTTLIQTVVGSSFSIALRNLVLLAGSSMLLIWTSPLLASVVLLAVPAILVPIIFFGRAVRSLSRASQDRVADTSAYAGESIAAIQTVQAFTHEEIDRTRFGDTVESSFRTAIARVRARALMTVLVIFVVFGSIVGVLWFGATQVMSGALSAGELSQFILYAVLMATGVGALSEVWTEVQRAAGAAERLMELLSIAPQIAPPADPKPLPKPVRGALAFENVTFRYPQRPAVSALSRLTLRVAPGETVALVGPSGAGKSTVFQLLMRFFDPQEGRVTLDGVPLAALDPRDVRAVMALVPQDTAIFAASAADNIRYGRPGAGDAEVRAAAEAAQAHGFIARLPQGYETLLGERGVLLSGGQRQRIAIARAILRDAPVLLLDEATSALDAESEAAVQRALEGLMGSRTTVVIAHRLATVRRADRIIVMDHGQIIAEGTHAELVAKGGLYARLADLQFRDAEAAAAE